MVITSTWAFESSLLNLPGLTETIIILSQAFPRLSALKCLAICRSSEVDSKRPWIYNHLWSVLGRSDGRFPGRGWNPTRWKWHWKDILDVHMPHSTNFQGFPWISTEVASGLPVDIAQALPAALLLPLGNRVRAFQSPLEAVQAPKAGTRSSQFQHGRKNMKMIRAK